MFVSENEFRHGKDSTVKYNATIFRKKIGGKSIFSLFYLVKTMKQDFSRDIFIFHSKSHFSSSSNYEFDLVLKLLPLLTFLSLMKSLKR
ncbi:hypothetical protein BpHYR1_026173 [Brachionus plicatilis]|uniref:Uncharacterized protein n=1 Tax=Brachionus plicatilis TaxID=10195 RepID=A0A3M7QRQ8_BRAPC|nr:hypothetical protein BpHYR1_026173 [Brachionus plicatilis]